MLPGMTLDDLNTLGLYTISAVSELVGAQPSTIRAIIRRHKAQFTPRYGQKRPHLRLYRLFTIGEVRLIHQLVVTRGTRPIYPRRSVRQPGRHKRRP